MSFINQGEGWYVDKYILETSINVKCITVSNTKVNKMVLEFVRPGTMSIIAISFTSPLQPSPTTYIDFNSIIFEGFYI